MELLDRIEREIKQRLEELRPLVAEARELEEALRQLPPRRSSLARSGAQTRGRTARAKTTPKKEVRSAAAPPRRRATRRRPRTRMSGRERREQVLSIIGDNPDIKARAIADQIGTTPNNVYNLVRRLEAEGALRRRDGRFVVRQAARRGAAKTD